MDAISQMTFSNAFPWIKIHEFRVRFHWILFLRIELTILQHWFRKWLGAGQATSHYLNQWWLFYWRIYASLGLNELKNFNSIARPYDEHAFSPFNITAGWLPYLAINMFLVNFDALAHTYITPGIYKCTKFCWLTLSKHLLINILSCVFEGQSWWVRVVKPMMYVYGLLTWQK